MAHPLLVPYTSLTRPLNIPYLCLTLPPHPILYASHICPLEVPQTSLTCLLPTHPPLNFLEAPTAPLPPSTLDYQEPLTTIKAHVGQVSEPAS